LFGEDGKHGHFTPLIITRDPIERIWSAFRYFKPKETFKDYLLTDLEQNFGAYNPIIGSNYKRWIEPFLKYDPVIVSLEFMSKMPGFPKANVTPHFYDMPKEDLLLAKRLFELELKGEFWNEEKFRPTDKAFYTANKNP
jgi:hypothetical protein